MGRYSRKDMIEFANFAKSYQSSRKVEDAYEAYLKGARSYPKRRFLFVGEERSNRAIEMGVTWKDKRLAAAHLSKAVESLGIDWDKCRFMNVFEDDIEDIRKFRGTVVAMGRKVERELKRQGVKHMYIHHPAARGKIRIIENYKAHVKEQLKSVI
jgi:hypothetical protein